MMEKLIRRKGACGARIKSNIILISLLTASCNLAPTYHPATIPDTPKAYKESKGWQPAHPADQTPGTAWWKLFGDDELNKLEERVVPANQDVKAALAVYEQAKQGAAIARAAYFPTVSGTANLDRQRYSKSIDSAYGGLTENDYTVGADISYEIDVWGKVRNMVASANRRTAASRADLAAMALSMQAELAGDYFSLRGDDALQVILDQTVDAYQKALALNIRRYQGGAGTAMEVSQAETQYYNAKTQAADTHLKRAQLEHAIAVLIGEDPSSFSLTVRPLTVVHPPVVKTGLPSTLLERRPDIAAAERRMAAANSDIGVARAAWFPSFDLTSFLGVESLNTSNLFKGASSAWSLGPSITAPLFEGGQILAANKAAKAAYDQQVANYRKTVLTAYQEVEDNLVGLRQLELENTSQTAATAAADRTLAQAQNRYKGGVTTYLDVVVAEDQDLQAKTASINIKVEQMNASIQLIKALGGGI